MAEDRLRQEAKSLIEQIKHLRVQTREAQEASDDDLALQRARFTGAKAPELLENPKMRRVLKGHFGKVRKNIIKDLLNLRKWQTLCLGL